MSKNVTITTHSYCPRCREGKDGNLVPLIVEGKIAKCKKHGEIRAIHPREAVKSLPAEKAEEILTDAIEPKFDVEETEDIEEEAEEETEVEDKKTFLNWK